MYVELALFLFAIGLYGIIAGDELKKLIGLGFLLAAPNLLLVFSGAQILVILSLVIDTGLIAALMILYLLEVKNA